MTLAVWLVASLALALATIRRPSIAVFLCICVWVCVPDAAASLITGLTSGPGNLHPATYLYVIVLAIQLLFNWPFYKSELFDLPIAYVGILLIAALALLTTALSNPIGLIYISDSFLGPLLLFFLVRGASRVDPTTQRRAVMAIIILAAAESVFALVQLAASSTILFTNYYASQYWYVPTLNGRAMGTLDHPLVLGYFLAISVPFTLRARRTPIRIVVTAITIAGILASGSRTALVLAFVLVALSAVEDHRVRLLNAALASVVLVAGVYVLLSAQVGDTLSRFLDDGNSSAARSEAYSYFARNISSVIFDGPGYQSTVTLRGDGILTSSVENGYVSLILDLGLVVGAIYLALQVGIAIVALRNHGRPGAGVAILAGIVLSASFSSFASPNICAFALWLLMAVAMKTTRGETRVDVPVVRAPNGFGRGSLWATGLARSSNRAR